MRMQQHLLMNFYVLSYITFNFEMEKIMNPLTKSRKINIGSVYQHYNDKMYKVIAIAHDSENPELLRVIYQGLYTCSTFGENPVWDRPYEMFAEKVTINGVEQYRFTEIIAS